MATITETLSTTLAKLSHAAADRGACGVKV